MARADRTARAGGLAHAFVLAGVGVEIVGLVLVIRAHPLRRGAHE